LYLALEALGIKPGDEVIVPTMTFVATIQAITQNGATPVLVDCEPRTFNIDVDALTARLTPATRAIIVVHIGGRCCAMDRILELAKRHRLVIIEDCAHALESSYHGRPAGLLGDIGCFSFYATKSVTTGDGGMIITSHREVYERVKRRSLHGMDLDAWQRVRIAGQSYNVTSPGFKFNMTDLGAAMGLVQLRGVRDRWSARERLWESYDTHLRDLSLVTPPVPELDTVHGYHLYQVLLPPELGGNARDRVRAGLQAQRIGTGVHYRPVHVHPYFAASCGYRPNDFPVAHAVGQRTLSLPLNSDLTEREMKRVHAALTRILETNTANGPQDGRAAMNEVQP
jgi:dTDP-4-amino-4,6-dideoxygalactose transaminase